MSFLLFFLTNPIGRMIGVGAIALTVGLVQGYAIKARLDRSATLSAIVAKQKIDLQAAQAAAAEAEKTTAELSKTDADNQEIIRALQGNSCKLDDAGTRELLRLR